ncbi:MAG TPA: amidohydrolase family protein [Planctomycetota bacterium]|nr:amidohydrolase family protein [Planctomycetota bacterium]
MRTFALSFLFLLAAPLAPQEFALVGGTVHPGDGSPPIVDGVVIVQKGRITAVGPAASTPVPADMIKAGFRHLTPGLIDTHVHYSQTGWADGRPDATDVRKEFPYEAAMAQNAAHPEIYHRAFLHAGVTAVFDVGGYPWTRALGAATENDPMAPHVAAAGALLATYDLKLLTLPDQQQFLFPNTEDEARAYVRLHKAWGSAAIKVWYIETPGHGVDELSPIVHAAGDEAKKQGLPLIVHSTTLATARDAVDAGAHLLVHSVEDAEVDDAFVGAAKAAGTFYCPTLTVRDGYTMLYQGKLSDEVRAQLDAVHPSVKERVLRTEQLPHRNPRALEGMQQRIALQQKIMATNLMKLHAAGVPVVMGTDAGNPLTLHGPSVFVEMEAMVKGGMSAKDVLVSATRDAARAMGRGHDLGLIRKGYIADLLLLEADPEQDIKAFRTLQVVWRAGHLHERAALLQH